MTLVNICDGVFDKIIHWLKVPSLVFEIVLYTPVKVANKQL